MIELRRATPSDIPAICSLFRQSVQTVLPAYYSADQVRLWLCQADFDDLWSDRIESSHFILAEFGHELAGFGNFTHDANIEMLYSAPAYLGKGVASRILASFEEIAVGKGWPWIVADASEAALGFFTKHGFTLVRKQETFVAGAPFVNYKMVKDL